MRQRIARVVIVDERAPLSLTSDKSTEAYRNWWPGPDDAMIRLMNRSIFIWAESEGPGRGSTFVVRLPAGSPEARQA